MYVYPVGVVVAGVRATRGRRVRGAGGRVVTVGTTTTEAGRTRHRVSHARQHDVDKRALHTYFFCRTRRAGPV